MTSKKARGNDTGGDNLEKKKIGICSKFQKANYFNDRMEYSSDLDFFFCLMFAFCFLSFLISNMALYGAGDWTRHFNVPYH